MRTRWRVTTGVVFTGILLAAAPGPAGAQPRAPVSEATKDAARNSYRAAELKFKEGNYGLALEYYMQAESILPVYATKYKIAVCNDRLNRAVEAMRWYQAFLDASPPEKVAADVADARARIVALGKTATGSFRLLVNPPNAPRLSASIDGGPPQSVASVLSAGPGRHRVVVQADGYGPTAVDVDVTPGAMLNVNVALAPAGAVVQPGPGPGPGQVVMVQRSNVPAYVLFGVTGVGVILGGVFGGMALSSKSAFNSHPRGDTSDANNEQTYAQVSDASFGVAIAAGVTGLILLLTNKPHAVAVGAAGEPAAPQNRAFLTPYAGPTGGGLTGGVTF
jgi:hypothetical protein